MQENVQESQRAWKSSVEGQKERPLSAHSFGKLPLRSVIQPRGWLGVGALVSLVDSQTARREASSHQVQPQRYVPPTGSPSWSLGVPCPLPGGPEGRAPASILGDWGLPQRL